MASAPDGITAGWCQQWRLLSQKAGPAGATVGGGGRHSIGLENMCIGWGRACMGAECPCTLALAELDRAGAPALPCHCLHAHLPACHSNRGCISKPGPAAHRSGRAPGKVWAVNLQLGAASPPGPLPWLGERCSRPSSAQGCKSGSLPSVAECKYAAGPRSSRLKRLTCSKIASNTHQTTSNSRAQGGGPMLAARHVCRPALHPNPSTCKGF